jgi:hypothetical protein
MFVFVRVPKGRESYHRLLVVYDHTGTVRGVLSFASHSRIKHAKDEKEQRLSGQGT